MIKKYFFYVLVITSSAQLQANMMGEMALMMGAQMGASIANQSISKIYQDAAKGIQADQTSMNNASTEFFTHVSAAQSAQETAIFNIYNAAQTQVSSLDTQQSAMMQQMQSYIQSTVDVTQVPNPEYLRNPAYWDEMFTNATMYTPKGKVWKNLFQIGNWQYDESTNSFWQMQQTPFLTPPGAGSSTGPTNHADQNAIFAEWSTKQPYEIECDITLYQVSYPFYAGIIFNKSRWVSGDTYGLQKYRTLGLYGNSNKQISLCYAQQTMPAPLANATQPPTPNYPLAAIAAGSGVQQTTLTQTSFQSIDSQPLTLHLKIRPEAQTVLYKIWAHGTTQPSNYQTIKTNPGKIKSPKSFTVTGQNGSTYTYKMVNDDQLFLYHGIGFLSPGAIAQFKLISPRPLLFSAASVQTFKQDFTAYVANQSKG